MAAIVGPHGPRIARTSYRVTVQLVARLLGVGESRNGTESI